MLATEKWFMKIWIDFSLSSIIFKQLYVLCQEYLMPCHSRRDSRIKGYVIDIKAILSWNSVGKI